MELQRAKVEPEQIVLKVGTLEVTGCATAKDWSVRLDGVPKPVRRIVVTLSVDGPPVAEMEWYPGYEFRPGSRTLHPVVMPDDPHLVEPAR